MTLPEFLRGAEDCTEQGTWGSWSEHFWVLTLVFGSSVGWDGICHPVITAFGFVTSLPFSLTYFFFSAYFYINVMKRICVIGGACRGHSDFKPVTCGRGLQHYEVCCARGGCTEGKAIG